MQKIIDKHQLDINNREKNPEHVDIHDNHHGNIITDIRYRQNGTRKGIVTCSPDDLYYLCLDIDELEISGWDLIKQKWINDGTITQTDIDIEKIKPEIITKKQEWWAKILVDVDKDPKFKIKINAIKRKHGKPELP